MRTNDVSMSDLITRLENEVNEVRKTTLQLKVFHPAKLIHEIVDRWLTTAPKEYVIAELRQIYAFYADVCSECLTASREMETGLCEECQEAWEESQEFDQLF